MILTTFPLSVTSAYAPIVFRFYEASLTEITRFEVKVYDATAATLLATVFVPVNAVNPSLNLHFGEVDVQSIIAETVAPQLNVYNLSAGTNTLYSTGFGVTRFYCVIDSYAKNATTLLVSKVNNPLTTAVFDAIPSVPDAKTDAQVGLVYSNTVSGGLKQFMHPRGSARVLASQDYFLTAYCDANGMNAARVKAVYKNGSTNYGFHMFTQVARSLISVNVGPATFASLDDVGFFAPVTLTNLVRYEVEFGIFTATSGPGLHTWQGLTLKQFFTIADCETRDTTTLRFLTKQGGFAQIPFTNRKEIFDAAKSTRAANERNWRGVDGLDPVKRTEFKQNIVTGSSVALEIEDVERSEQWFTQVVSSPDVYLIEDVNMYPVTVFDGEVNIYDNKELYDGMKIKYNLANNFNPQNF